MKVVDYSPSQLDLPEPNAHALIFIPRTPKLHVLSRTVIRETYLGSAVEAPDDMVEVVQVVRFFQELCLSDPQCACVQGEVVVHVGVVHV